MYQYLPPTASFRLCKLYACAIVKIAHRDYVCVWVMDCRWNVWKKGITFDSSGLCDNAVSLRTCPIFACGREIKLVYSSDRRTSYVSVLLTTSSKCTALDSICIGLTRTFPNIFSWDGAWNARIRARESERASKWVRVICGSYNIG